MKYVPLEERFWAKVDRSAGPDGCWLWTATTWKGYGLIWVGGKRSSRRAHRLAYEMLVGPIPEGLELDHLCRVRQCVNPAHLEPVVRAENILRGVSPGALNARKTHCKRGHEFTPDNTYWSAKGRECRACRRILNAGYAELRRKAAGE